MQSRTPLFPGAILSTICLVLAALLARLPVPAVPTVSVAPCKQAPAPSKPSCMQPAKLRLADGIGPVVPVAGESRRIEDLFVELNGQLWVGGVGYRVSDGVFKSLQGARAWVAVRPGSLHTSPLGLRLVLFELNGHIYYAGLQKAS